MAPGHAFQKKSLAYRPARLFTRARTQRGPFCALARPFFPVRRRLSKFRSYLFVFRFRERRANSVQSVKKKGPWHSLFSRVARSRAVGNLYTRSPTIACIIIMAQSCRPVSFLALFTACWKVENARPLFTDAQVHNSPKT